MAIKIKNSIISAGNIIRTLMQEADIGESELARQTNLPQTTINRLLLGGTSDPRAHTLKPIADFFGVTIGQLCGFESLNKNRIVGSTNSINRAAWQSIPIIEWEMVSSWLFKRKSITPTNHQRWITTERTISNHSFALTSLAFMEPRFRKGSVLIIDPAAKFKDGHFILLAVNNQQPTVRKVLMDGADILLKSFDEPQPMIKLTKKHVIFGTILESRLDTYNNESF